MADSEHDIDNLIEKTEKEGDQVEPESGAGSLFAFAKVWSADKDGLEDMPDVVAETPDEADSWAKALQLIATERDKQREKEVTGRGVRRKAAAVFPQVSGLANPSARFVLTPLQQSLDLGDTPTKDQNKSRKRKHSRSKSAGSDGDSDFHAVQSDVASESDNTAAEVMDIDDVHMLDARGSSPPVPLATKRGFKTTARRRQKNHDRTLSPIDNRQHASERQQGEFCGLCGKVHQPGHCSMTESPENLAQYRLMLMQHAGDETLEERVGPPDRCLTRAVHSLTRCHTTACCHPGDR